MESVARESYTQSIAMEKRVCHPFLCRLKETAAFSTVQQEALIASGFASMALGLLTFFRPAPLLLFLLVTHASKRLKFIHGKLLVMVIFLWGAIVMFVLIGTGFVLTFSVRIQSRAVLLLHPWAMMIMYLDVAVWLTLALYLHLKVLSVGALDETTFTAIQHPLAYFIVIYCDCVLFFLLHYVFTTYFITAELSVIERCY